MRDWTQGMLNLAVMDYRDRGASALAPLLLLRRADSRRPQITMSSSATFRSTSTTSSRSRHSSPSPSSRSLLAVAVASLMPTSSRAGGSPSSAAPAPAASASRFCSSLSRSTSRRRCASGRSAPSRSSRRRSRASASATSPAGSASSPTRASRRASMRCNVRERTVRCPPRCSILLLDRKLTVRAHARRRCHLVRPLVQAGVDPGPVAHCAHQGLGPRRRSWAQALTAGARERPHPRQRRALGRDGRHHRSAQSVRRSRSFSRTLMNALLTSSRRAQGQEGRPARAGSAPLAQGQGRRQPRRPLLLSPARRPVFFAVSPRRRAGRQRPADLPRPARPLHPRPLVPPRRRRPLCLVLGPRRLPALPAPARLRGAAACLGRPERRRRRRARARGRGLGDGDRCGRRGRCGGRDRAEAGRDALAQGRVAEVGAAQRQGADAQGQEGEGAPAH